MRTRPVNQATAGELAAKRSGSQSATANVPRAPAGLRPLTSTQVLGNILACLVLGHLAISGFFPSLIINGAGIAIVTGILGRLLFIKKDVFAYLMVVLFCSLFDYANHQGGLFNLAAFLLGALYLLFGPGIRETRARDGLISFLVIVLLLSNVVGLMGRNPMPLFVLLLQGASFTGILFTFLIASHVHLTPARIRVLLNVSAVMMSYNFLVSLNQHYSVLKIATPLLGLTSELLYATTNAFGVLGSASANGQFGMMMLALLAPLVAASSSKEKLKIAPLHYVPVIALCAFTIVLANMRAAAVEAVLIMIIYTFIFSFLHRRSFRNAQYINLASAAALILLVTAGAWVGLQNIQHDLEAVQIDSTAGITSGDALNRGGPWKWGMHVLKEGNWWIGYGHGNDKSNTLAWGGKWTGTGKMSQMLKAGEIIGGGHFHNLYLALPTLYGWIGAVAYVLLFLVVVWRLVGAIRRYPFDNIVVATCLGFAVSLMFFLLDEGKSGNAVQKINYAMIAWIWLGLGLAAFRTLNRDMAEARAMKAQEREKGGGENENESERPTSPTRPEVKGWRPDPR